MNIEKIKHNNLEFDAIRIQLRPEQLILLYASAVTTTYCKHCTIVFLTDSLWVSIEDDVIDFCYSWFEEHSIYPDMKLNPAYYELVNKLSEKD